MKKKLHTENIFFRCTEQEKERIEKAAANLGMALSVFVRYAILRMVNMENNKNEMAKKMID